eukprot:2051172-Rhodomonas_salina.2
MMLLLPPRLVGVPSPLGFAELLLEGVVSSPLKRKGRFPGRGQLASSAPSTPCSPSLSAPSLSSVPRVCSPSPRASRLLSESSRSACLCSNARALASPSLSPVVALEQAALAERPQPAGSTGARELGPEVEEHAVLEAACDARRAPYVSRMLSTVWTRHTCDVLMAVRCVDAHASEREREVRLGATGTCCLGQRLAMRCGVLARTPRNQIQETCTYEGSSRRTAIDATTSKSVAELCDAAFSTSGHPINLGSQYPGCSNNQLNLYPASGANIEGREVSGRVSVTVG